jgi:TorA maturation chaperone TorD
VGTLLLRPDPVLLQWLAARPVPESAAAAAPADTLQDAWAALLQAARQPPEDVAAAHAALFVGLGNPAIDPYASRYVDGTLMNQSLAQLRRDLQALGLARVPGSRELEDHLGALCQAMGQLVLRAPPTVQRAFLRDHLAPWCGRCLQDIATHPRAGFYAALARFAAAFVAGEQEALSDVEAPPWD